MSLKNGSKWRLLKIVVEWVKKAVVKILVKWLLKAAFQNRCRMGQKGGWCKLVKLVIPSYDTP